MVTEFAREINLTIPSSLGSLKYIIAKIQKNAHDAGLSEETLNITIPMLVAESVTNAIQHGNKFDKDKKVYVRLRYNADKFVLFVKDEGDGFKFDQIANPTHPENIYQESGRGIYLISSLADEYYFNEKGNEIKMVLNIK